MKSTRDIKEEAIEAWNTWPGRYKRPSRDAFLKTNYIWRHPHVAHMREVRGAIAAGKRDSKNQIYGAVLMLPDGTYEVPWPRPAVFQGTISGYSAQEVFLLRVRWLYLFEEGSDYQAVISQMLRSLDREGKAFENFAAKANAKLSGLDLPLLGPRDLRGICLAGFDLSGPPYEGICLRHFDLSFAEMSLAELDGANLYKAKLTGVAASDASLRYAVLVSSDLSHSMLSAIDLSGSDLSLANLAHSISHRAVLDGTNFHQTDISSAQLTDISMRDECRNRTSVLSIDQLKYDSETRLNFRLPPSNIHIIPKDLLAVEPKSNQTLGQVVGDAVGLRPGLFGISIDLKAIGAFLFRRFPKQPPK